MASIRQKPSGAWEARYRDAGGRSHARTLRTKTEARRWAAEREADLRRGEWVDPRLARVTFGEWAADYLTTIVHLRTVTRGDYQRMLDGHLLPAFARRPIASIEPIDVRRFMAEKQAAGQAAKSLQKMRLVLRQVLELARASGAIKSNPCDGLRLPRAVQMEPIFLHAEQVETLARATRPPYDVLVRLVAATGLRPSEACGLRVGRVNLIKGTMEVSEALTVVGGRTEVGPTKTYARRTVGIPRSLCDDLGAHFADRIAALGRPLDPDDYVFTAPRGGPLRRDLLFKRFLRPAIETAGLPANLRLHDLRHSCAALLIELGAHPKAIQERLGHSSITVTMDVYGHLFPALNEALTERLDDVFRAARGTSVAPSGGAILALPAVHRDHPAATHPPFLESVGDHVRVSFDLLAFPPPGPSTVEEVRALLDEEERRLEEEAEGELPVEAPEMKAFIEDLESRWPSLDDDPDASPWSSWPLWQPLAGGGTALNIRWSWAEVVRAAVLEAAARANVIVFDPQTEELIQPGPAKQRGRGFFKRGR